jgi:hypothetical protein
MEVARGLDIQVDPGMSGQEIEHVVEEADPGGNRGRSGAIEIDCDRNVGFLGGAFDRCLAHARRLRLRALYQGFGGVATIAITRIRFDPGDEHARGAHIYLAEAKKPAIIAALYHNTVSATYEQEAPAVLSQWRDPIGLASALRAAVDRFSTKDRNLRDYKKTEWPSYMASDCRSVREFERVYFRITVQAVNAAELLYDAHAQPRGEGDIMLHVTLNRHGPDEEMGRKLLRLFDVCEDWRC